MNGKAPFAIDNAVLGGMGFGNPKWDWRTFDFDTDVELVDAKLFGVLNAVDPDLRDFKKRGGKLIVYHGWNDPGVMPQQTLDYYRQRRRVRRQGDRRRRRAYTDEYLRLFMMPGVGHCRGGVGPDQADWMARSRAGSRRARRPRRSRRARDARRQGRHDAAALPVSAGGALQGQRRHERRGELRVRRAEVSA